LLQFVLGFLFKQGFQHLPSEAGDPCRVLDVFDDCRIFVGEILVEAVNQFLNPRFDLNLLTHPYRLLYLPIAPLIFPSTGEKHACRTRKLVQELSDEPPARKSVVLWTTYTHSGNT